VCVCVCVCEREREREYNYTYTHAHTHTHTHTHACNAFAGIPGQSKTPDGHATGLSHPSFFLAFTCKRVLGLLATLDRLLEKITFKRQKAPFLPELNTPWPDRVCVCARARSALSVSVCVSLCVLVTNPSKGVHSLSHMHISAYTDMIPCLSLCSRNQNTFGIENDKNSNIGYKSVPGPHCHSRVEQKIAKSAAATGATEREHARARASARPSERHPEKK